MKRTTLSCLALVALVSCSKESTIDTQTSIQQIPIEYSAYATSAATKGAPVENNSDFIDTSIGYGSFEVAALVGDTANENGSTYFGFGTAAYSSSTWTSAARYWPNSDQELHFAAYSPTSVSTGTSKSLTDSSFAYAESAYDLNFKYSVTNTTANQVDLMYAITAHTYTAPTNATDAATVTPVSLNFKHALSQIAFKATKDTDLQVFVSELRICNVVNNGTFKATEITDDTATSGNTVESDYVELDNFGAWTAAAFAEDTSAGAAAQMSNYPAVLETYDATIPSTETDANYITIGTTATALSDTDDVLMLMPQALSAWVPNTNSNTAWSSTSTNTYLAINCLIYHGEATTTTTDTVIHSGWLYVPFSTLGLHLDANNADTDTNTIANAWNPGYKYTYTLNFGGGYYVPDSEGPQDPGETPDDEVDDDDDDDDEDEDKDVIQTLRAISYTVTVDEWVPTASTEYLIPSEAPAAE